MRIPPVLGASVRLPATLGGRDVGASGTLNLFDHLVKRGALACATEALCKTVVTYATKETALSLEKVHAGAARCEDVRFVATCDALPHREPTLDPQGFVEVSAPAPLAPKGYALKDSAKKHSAQTVSAPAGGAYPRLRGRDGPLAPPLCGAAGAATQRG